MFRPRGNDHLTAIGGGDYANCPEPSDAAELCVERSYDHRAVDEDGMVQHGGQQHNAVFFTHQRANADTPIRNPLIYTFRS